MAQSGMEQLFTQCLGMALKYLPESVQKEIAASLVRLVGLQEQVDRIEANQITMMVHFGLTPKEPRHGPDVSATAARSLQHDSARAAGNR